MSNSVFGDLDGLLSHVDSKFSLVNVVTKRAKQLNNGAPPLTEGVTVPEPAAGPTEAGLFVQVRPPVNAPVTAQAGAVACAAPS